MHLISKIKHKYIFFALIAFAILFIYSIQKTGAVNTLSVFFEPGTSLLPANQILSLRINSELEKVGFIRISFAFDKTKMNLSGEIAKAPPFETEIEKTSMTEANSIGAARIVLAVPPSKVAEAPSGEFEVALIPLQVLSTQKNDTTVFIFNKEDIQVVDMEGKILDFDIVNPAYTLNFTPISLTNTPTPTPTATATIQPTNQTPTTSSTPTSTITPTTTSTPSPTNSVTPTIQATLTQTMTPTSSPTAIPTVTNTPIATATATVTTSPTNSPSPTISATETPTPTLKPKKDRRRLAWVSDFWNYCKSRFTSFFTRN